MHSNTICYFQSQTIDIVYPIEDGVNGLVPSLDRVCKEVSGIIKYLLLFVGQFGYFNPKRFLFVLVIIGFESCGEWMCIYSVN